MKNFPYIQNPTKKLASAIPRGFSIFFFLIFAKLLWGQGCPGDVTPPTAVCNEFTAVALTANGTATVSAAAFDDGSFDDCGIQSILLQRVVDGPCDADGLPDAFTPEIAFCCADLGAVLVVTMRVVDSAGNFNDCLMEVEVTDKIKPACIAPANTTVSCEMFDPSLFAYGNAEVLDNCTSAPSLTETRDLTKFDSLCSKGTITRLFKAQDDSGNSSNCTQRIFINYQQNYSIHFPDDVNTFDPNQTDFGEPTFDGVDCELIGVSYNDQVFTVVPDALFKIERKWTIINWCTYDPSASIINILNPNPNAVPNAAENLLGPVVSPSGSPGAWAPTLVSLVPGGPLFDYSALWTATANGYNYKQIIKVLPQPSGVVTGKIFEDASENCSFETGETLLANWPVRITGLVTGTVYETVTDVIGQYSQAVLAVDTLAEVTLAAPGNFGQNCPTTFIVPIIENGSTGQNIAVHLESQCPILSVDISSPLMRRCFDNTYFVNYANLSAQTIANAHVEVQLDPFQTFETSSIPGTPLGGNLHSFALGNLAAGQTGGFNLTFNLSCDAPFGATHCAEAHIFPDTVCGGNANWTGSNLVARGICDADSVRLSFQNIGSGPMSQAAEYVVVEDVILFRSASFQLGPGETMTLDALPANGTTWRMESWQENGHPFGGPVAVAVEGCGGIQTTGLVTMFPLNPPNPFQSIDCQQNRGSFDPNDKQAFPAGFGQQHLLKANTDLEYLIRFQNTGTDTAFTVVVLDTLSERLSPESLRPGASSHAYDFSILDGNVARFTFRDILLPDSNTNEAASHGFIKFRIRQQPDNALGTVIRNSAAIYFDFNAPVITNETWYTIGDDFILIRTDSPSDLGQKVKIWPNPVAGEAFFELEEGVRDAQFQLTDAFEKVVREGNFSGSRYRFERGGLASGVYFFKLRGEGLGLVSGKVVLK